MRYETCSDHFGNSARPCGCCRLFWVTNFVRSAKDRYQSANGRRNSHAGRSAKKTGSQAGCSTRTGACCSITTATVRCRGTATTSFGNARTRPGASASAAESEAKTQTKTEAQSGEEGQAEKTGKGRTGCPKAETQTTAARRVSKTAQGSDQAQETCPQGRQGDPKGRQVTADTRSIRLCASADGKRIIQTGSATDRSVLEYSRRGKRRPENENRGPNPAQSRRCVDRCAAGDRQKPVQQRSIVPGCGRKCRSRTFESTLQPFAVTLWPIRDMEGHYVQF